jgi:hypothetical protein
MRNKKAYKAYTDGAQYGKFGSGDHKSEGGKVVKGITGKIHIKGGIETDIMKTHGPEGEFILAQRKGYPSLDAVPRNETTGYAQYGDTWDWLFGENSAWQNNVFTGSGLGSGIANLFGYTEAAGKDLGMGISTFNLPTGDESKRRDLGKMLGVQTKSAIAGQAEMEGFIDENLSEQLLQFGAKSEMLDTAEDRLGTQTTGVQRDMSKQYGGVRDMSAKTGLVGTSQDQDYLKDIELTGKTAMENIGSSRLDIGSQRDILASQERGATTQAEIDKLRGKQNTQQALASMISDYMSATGETVDDDIFDLFTEYMEEGDQV